MVALSYWHDSLDPDDSLEPRAALTSDRDADVAIVGAGFTGLWTAHSLLRADPSIRVVVLEREPARRATAAAEPRCALPGAARHRHHAPLGWCARRAA